MAAAQTSSSAVHTPVMRDEAIAALAPRAGALYVDGTFGAGGYSAALLAAADCRVYALDRDPDAIARGRALAAQSNGRLELIEGRFGDMDRLLAARDVTLVHGVVLDLGVSSPQLDEAARGFSFRHDGPLDMRMDPTRGESAAQWLEHAEEQQIREVIREYGEERFAKQIAAAIVAARQGRPLTRTRELADLVGQAVRTREPGQDPATRTFQEIGRAHV
mgnify:CR=1 FL=1